MSGVQVQERGIPISIPTGVFVGGRLRRPRLLRVTGRIYSAVGYAISNVLYVITGGSVVVIDTTESMAAAQLSFDEFRKICGLPVSYIVYTHSHGDHIRGARVFHEPSTRVISQRRLPEELAYATRMGAYRKRSTALQFGLKLRRERRGVALAGGKESGYVPPDILIDEEYRFEEGGLSFELYHTQGETADHLMVWIPEERALFPGDLYYARFPMLSSPMRPDRPVHAWAESLERMRTFQPEHLVPSHSEPVSGAEKIDLVLSNYARAIRYIYDETIKGINEGLPLEDIRHQVKLPDDLAALPYLEQRYGTVAWSVNGIFRQHTGWYHFDPADLNPAAKFELREALLEATGGPAPLVKRARQALREGQDQLALELADAVLGPRPRNLGALAVRIRALRRLAGASQNGVEQNIYRTAANEAVSALDALDAMPADAGRVDYSGVWTRPSQGSLPAAATGTNRHFGRAGAVTRSIKLEKKTATLVNRLYDERMYLPAVEERYAGSGFHNFGYWTGDTRTQTQACENLMQVLLDFIPSKTGTILDVACGMGGTTRFLLREYRPENITGINISPRQLKRCGRIAPGCRFLEMNATAMRFENASFDNVICVESAFHFVTRAKFLRGAFRILKPGGRLVLTDTVPTADRTPNWYCPTERILSPSEYRDLYFRAGFDRVEIVDATAECSAGHRRHSLRLLRNAWLNGMIGLDTFRERVRMVQSEHQIYYLLVCARKRDFP